MDGTTVRSEPVSDTLRALVRPAMLSAPGHVDIYVRGFDRALYHARKVEPARRGAHGGWIPDFPTAAATSGSSGVTRLVFVRGLDGQIVQMSSVDDAPWQWQLVHAPDATWQFAGGTERGQLWRRRGGADADRRRLARHAHANDHRLDVREQRWCADRQPVAVCGGAYARDRDGAPAFFDGTAWTSRGGSLD
ncbi:MAG TPA: hypothetical protein VIB48_17120 [Acidimicrobiia bacterium]